MSFQLPKHHPLSETAIVRIMRGQFTEEEILQGLKRPPPANYAMFERRFVQALCPINQTFLSKLAVVMDKFPPAVLRACPELSRYSEQVKVIGDYHDHQLQADAMAWANSVMDDQPELLAAFFTSEEGANSLHDGLALAFQPKASSKRGGDKHLHSLGVAVSRAKLAFDAVEPQWESLSQEDICLLFMDAAYGGFRPVILGVLCRQYACFFLCITCVFLGAPPSVIEEIHEMAAWDALDDALNDDMGFIELFSGDLFDPVPLMALDLGVEFQQGLSGITRGYRYDLGVLANAFDASITEAKATERSLRKEIEQTKKALQLAQKSVDRLTQQQRENTAILRLNEENSRLSRELNAAHERIARLEAQLQRAGTAAPDEPPPPAPPAPAPAPEAPPVVATTYEEDLAFLNALNGVLIGGHGNFVGKAKRLLPNWKFFPAALTTADDGVVASAQVILCFTDHCGHTLYEGTMRIARAGSIPVAYAHRVNPHAFIREAAAEIRQVMA